MFLRRQGIEARLSTAIDHIEDGALLLADGEELPYAGPGLNRITTIISPLDCSGDWQLNSVAGA